MSVPIDARTLRFLAEESGLMHRPASVGSMGPGNLLYLAIQTALIREREITRLKRKIERIKAVVDAELGDEDA